MDYKSDTESKQYTIKLQSESSTALQSNKIFFWDIIVYASIYEKHHHATWLQFEAILITNVLKSW